MIFATSEEEKKSDKPEVMKVQEEASSDKESEGQAEEAQPIRAFIFSNRIFYYEGDPIEIEISLTNSSKEVLKNPVDSPFVKGFILKDEEGKQIEPKISKEDEEEQHPTKLNPEYFYGILLDITKNFSALTKNGKYKLQWKSGDIESNELDISVIKRYSPEKEYYAVIETDYGSFKLDFFKKEAPLAVKAFIDLANGGYYDGQIFFQVKPADYIMAGDPKGDGTGTSGLLFPAEYSEIPAVSGTVLMNQFIGGPPRNDGKFFITLKPRPEKTGFLTVFAQVIDGLDVVKKISIVPTTEDVHKPYFKPLKDILINKISIFEKEQKSE